MDPKTDRPAQAHIHRSTEIYCVRVFSFVTAGQVTHALTVRALQRTWFYLHAVIGSRPPT